MNPIRAYRSSPEALAVAKLYRDQRRADNNCVNHSNRPRQIGSRCVECYWRHRMGPRPDVWQRSLELQRELVRIARIR